MNIEIVKNSKKHLIIIDLDGTVLNSDFATLNQKNKKILQKLQEMGNKIVIATGRNYLSALPFYREIGLDTFLITYNGAYIDHPLKKHSPIMAILPLANETVKKILNEKIIKENLLNVLIDSADKETISTGEDIYYHEIFFNGNTYHATNDALQHLGDRDCLQLVLEFKNDKEKIDSIRSFLGENYKASVDYYSGKKLKSEKEGDKILVPDPEKVIFKIRSSKADKAEAVAKLAAYYNIDESRIIAFGNDVNDIKMIENVGWGVAMSNGNDDLKPYARSITRLDNHHGGVAEYLIKYFQMSSQN
ncbi:Putative conserved haloacid dehalogenase-like hydrolase protein [endosymbiont DhMRE of Dentiscutata heterogama]|uniref:Cof-type HAD-IIB family hydrolase n=1 Tax=endosymbiont DhMRE of Dentiscutata heterogama TaxID=1609546 RepID=UPI000629DC16|nr:Cof-type HAD-IIB family hydrolase [endosymbiont DhMRE of Dentiscutata heterogama]CFW93475.1 Putative conserved haloacid dehalogenase-like hydrolase protein [endosymbiont DhMRE of Dentiscutata heterogama]